MPPRDDYRGMAGPHKAAILMLALGEERCTQIFGLMHEDEIKELSAAMAQLGPVHADTVALSSAAAREYSVRYTSSTLVLASTCTNDSSCGRRPIAAYRNCVESCSGESAQRARTRAHKRYTTTSRHTHTSASR